MTKETQSYIDMLRNFGTNFGLPQVDVEKLLETNRKNLEALGESAKVAAGGAQSVAQKQREILERVARSLGSGPRLPANGKRAGNPRQADGVRKKSLRYFRPGSQRLGRAGDAIDRRSGENHSGANEGEPGGNPRQRQPPKRARGIRDAQGLTHAMEGRLPRGFCFKRLTDLPMLWSEQWGTIGLQAPAQVRAELR